MIPGFGWMYCFHLQGRSDIRGLQGTYCEERGNMFLRNVETIYKIIFSHNPDNTIYKTSVWNTGTLFNDILSWWDCTKSGQMKEIRIWVTCGMLLTRVEWYWHVCNDTETCGIILTRVELYWHVWNYTDTCGMILKRVELYWHVWNDTDTCGIILTRVELYWHVWNDTDTCGMILTSVG